MESAGNPRQTGIGQLLSRDLANVQTGIGQLLSRDLANVLTGIGQLLSRDLANDRACLKQLTSIFTQSWTGPRDLISTKS